ncbi:microsomal triglyceride transfer protein large subunit-like protein [Willisornis vidua]|uniref:Microsomal triglyceride transfer protein large subunit-like protein n=1 Tax=Willisornis vidua TaxID=1566151 RepID=A0ABQ9DRE8_9PASS|nr:microsomal triglyceride transfer protein large subunit-like protein [Willisornis vidua]
MWVETTGDLQLLSFQPRTLYQYHYSLAVQLDHVSTPSPGGARLWAEALLHVHQLWRDQGGEELLQLQIRDLKARHEPAKEKSQNGTGGLPAQIELSQEAWAELQQPVFISWNSGKVKAFYGNEAENILISNLKRGIISLLQLQPHAGTTVEVFGVQWLPTSRSQYVVKDNLLQSALAEETHVVAPALRSNSGIKISSRQQLQLLSPPMPGPAEVSGQSLEDVLAGTKGQHQHLGMASLPFRRVCTQCPSLRAFLKAFDRRGVRTDPAKVATTWQFQRFIQMLRSAKKRDVLELLRRAPEEMRPFIVEAAVAAQSVASLAALSDFLDFSKEPKSLLEKFLYAAAFSPRPSAELLCLVLDKLVGKQLAPEIWETGIVAMGSLVGKLCQQKLCGLQEVERGVEIILRGLRGAKEEPEVVIHLLALGNAVLPETIPTLLGHAEEGPAAVTTTAISALRRFPAQHISPKVKRAMRRIFHEKRKSYEKTCRLAAAEILLDNHPSPMDVINILLATNEMETEMATLLLLKVQNSLHAHHHPARKIVKDIMRDPRINNYNFFSKAGISSSFSGPLTGDNIEHIDPMVPTLGKEEAVTQDLLSTFGLDLLFLEGGFLRKSISEFSLLSHGQWLQAAQVTIEAQGMESMMGENISDGEEEPELTAGMSVIFFDVQLRPIVFFQGYTDLMAKVLLSSGEPTSVVKGNLLLMDHHQVIPLQSGLQVTIKLQGGLGLDISADMDVSIWEQELKTTMNTRGSLAMDFQAELDSPFLQATLRSQTEVETSIHFDTMLRFSSSPVFMCLQLREDQVPYRDIFTVSKSAGSQSSTTRKGRRGTVPGREFALHQTNSKVCNLLLTAEKE